jgi:hypothetical protein
MKSTQRTHSSNFAGKDNSMVPAGTLTKHRVTLVLQKVMGESFAKTAKRASPPHKISHLTIW